MPRERIFRIIERETIKDGKKVTKIYARTSYKGRDGKRHTIWRQGDTKTEAKDRLKKALDEVERHGEDLVERSRSTFDELADYVKDRYLVEAEYHDDVKVRGLRSWNKTRSQLKPLREFFGSMRLRDIRHRDVADYKRLRLATPTGRVKDEDGNPIGKRSISSVQRELALLRKMFNIAVRERWMFSNPFNEGDPLISPADEVQRERIFTYDEERRLFEAADSDGRRTHLHAVLLALIETGMRRGEMSALCWKDVDFKTRIAWATSYKGKRKLRRPVPITEKLHPVLIALWEESTKDPEAEVFGVADIKRSWQTIRRITGLTDVRLHDVRHVAATRMIESGMEVAEVGKILGHRQPQTTWRYINLNEDTIERASKGLDELRQRKEAEGAQESNEVN